MKKWTPMTHFRHPAFRWYKFGLCVMKTVGGVTRTKWEISVPDRRTDKPKTISPFHGGQWMCVCVWIINVYFLYLIDDESNLRFGASFATDVVVPLVASICSLACDPATRITQKITNLTLQLLVLWKLKSVHSSPLKGGHLIGNCLFQDTSYSKANYPHNI